MADYHSSLTGPEIDAALTRAKSGGEIDTLLSGKAPAGYGLGKTAYDTNAGTLANIDTYVENGWWRFDAVGVYDAIGVIANHSVLRVDAGRTIVQTLFLSWCDAVVTRIKIETESAWRDWEWVNPPMVVGTEYRTTERYNGKPVYVKAISCGAMPNATTTKVSDEFRATSIISVDGVTSGGTHFPTYSGHTASIGRIDVFVNIYGNIWITTTTDWSNETATIVLKYTKD